MAADLALTSALRLKRLAPLKTPQKDRPMVQQSESNCYALPLKGFDMLTQGSDGRLSPGLTWADVAKPVTVLDRFDHSLRQSGMLLLEIGPSFELLLPDGQVLSQSAERTGPFVANFQDGPVKFALKDLSPLRSLLPIGFGTLRRGVLALLDDEQRTHCRADLYRLTTGAGNGAVIATLHGLRGYDKSLADLRKHLEARGGTRLDRAKLYGALFPGHFAYVARPDVPIKADDTAFAAATDIIAAHIPVARANEAGIVADHDTEFLHDYRIALRKIRSVLSLFKGVYDAQQTADLKRRFSELMGPTGRLRDLDVYLLERTRYYALLPQALHGGLDKMFAMFAAERTVEKAKLARHLGSKAYEKEISRLSRLFRKRRKLGAGPKAALGVHDYACDLIWKRYRNICKTARGIGPDTADADVHVLRIHCKKLRYLMEFFDPLFPEAEFKALLRPLRSLQDSLGSYNDCSVQQVNLQAFLHEPMRWPDGVNVEVAQSVDALIAVLHRRQLEERARVTDALAQFDSPMTQMRFRDLFHGRSHKS